MQSTKTARTNNASTKRATKNTPHGKKPLPAEVLTATALVGVFERVARNLQRSPSHVRRVAYGERPSRLIINAIVEEVRRVLAEAAAA